MLHCSTIKFWEEYRLKNGQTPITENHHEAKCNPAKIMAAARNNQVAIAVRNNPVFSGTFVPSRKECLDIFIKAQRTIDEFTEGLTPDFRTPRDVIAFLARPENRPKAEELGLINRKPKKRPPVEVVVTPADGGGQGAGT